MIEAKADGRARAVYDTAAGRLLAGVDLSVPPERVYQALVGREVTAWWVNPGVFDTREWEAEPRVGGKWRATGIGRGKPYVLEGEFTEVDPPRKLVHTWRSVGGPAQDTTVSYLMDPIGSGTHLTLRHEGFVDATACVRTCIGWESSLEALARILGAR